MKKLIQMGALFCGLLLANAAFAITGPDNQMYNPSDVPTVFGGECPQAHAHPDGIQCGQATGECYCLMVRYKPCYYTTQRCVQEAIPCTRQCVRYVDKYYECQKCKYVPQYYCETYCQKCPECYTVPDCKYCTKTVCDQHCKWVPEYYWTHKCEPACPPCPPSGY